MSNKKAPHSGGARDLRGLPVFAPASHALNFSESSSMAYVLPNRAASISPRLMALLRVVRCTPLSRASCAIVLILHLDPVFLADFFAQLVDEAHELVCLVNRAMVMLRVEFCKILAVFLEEFFEVDHRDVAIRPAKLATRGVVAMASGNQVHLAPFDDRSANPTVRFHALSKS